MSKKPTVLQAFVLVSLIANSSCASVERWMHADGMTDAERRAANAEADRAQAIAQLQVAAAASREADDARRKQKAAFKVGTNYDTFVEAYGEPDSTEMSDNSLQAHYQIQGKYMVVVFTNERLVGWKADQAAAQRAHEVALENNRQEAEDRQQQEQIAADAQAANQRYWQEYRLQAVRGYQQQEHDKRVRRNAARAPARGVRCSGLAPLASIGCRSVCINGAWADVCN